MSSIEFGILESWSTTSLVPEFRVDLEDDQFCKLRSILDRITRRTGIEFDPYSSACLDDMTLDVFIEEMSVGAAITGGETKAIMDKLVRSSQHAMHSKRSFHFQGM